MLNDHAVPFSLGMSKRVILPSDVMVFEYCCRDTRVVLFPLFSLLSMSAIGDMEDCLKNVKRKAVPRCQKDS